MIGFRVRHLLVIVGCTWIAVACAVPTVEEVDSSRQAILPSLFDLPDHGETKVKTGFHAKGGPGDPTGDNPGFCFFMRIKGPFHGLAPFDETNDPTKDSFVGILPVDGEWVGEISSASPTPEVTIGCVSFAELINAGKVTTEGGLTTYIEQTEGAKQNTTAPLPYSPLATPSFCTLNHFRGNLAKPYGNCTEDSSVELLTGVDPKRTSDGATLSVNGMTCDAIDYPLWCLTCPNDQPRYVSKPTALTACSTRWSGMPGKGLIQIGPQDMPSLSTPLIPISKGICWISELKQDFGDPNEEATISPGLVGKEPWWVFQSTTNASASATCLEWDQTQ